MMTDLMISTNCVNGTGTPDGEGVAHGKALFGCGVGRTVIQQPHPLESDLMKIRLCSLNV